MRLGMCYGLALIKRTQARNKQRTIKLLAKLRIIKLRRGKRTRHIKDNKNYTRVTPWSE